MVYRRFWWCVDFCGSVCSFWRSRGRTGTGTYAELTAEGSRKGMLARIFSAFLQKPSLEVLFRSPVLGSSPPAACLLSTLCPEGCPGLMQSRLWNIHPLSKAIARMLLHGDLTLQSQGYKGLTSDESWVASVKETQLFAPFNASDLFIFIFSKGACATCYNGLNQEL